MKKLFLLPVVAFLLGGLLGFTTPDSFTFVEDRNSAEIHTADYEDVAGLEEIINSTGMPAHHRDYTWFVVEDVIDGDTIKIAKGDIKTVVRLIGVNTPESVSSDESKNCEAGEIASRYLKALIEGKKVRLSFDAELTDDYNRSLAYVFTTEGTFVNEALVRLGYAEVATIGSNTKYADILHTAQEAALKDGIGIWENADDNILYVGNTNSGKFHTEECDGAKSMSESNKIYFSSKEEAVLSGYESCLNCVSY